LLLNEYTNDRNSISYTEPNKFSDMIFGLKVSQPSPVSPTFLDNVCALVW